MDVSTRTVSRYEDGSFEPTREKLIRLFGLALEVKRPDLAEAFRTAIYRAHEDEAGEIREAIAAELVRVQRIATFSLGGLEGSPLVQNADARAERAYLREMYPVIAAVRESLQFLEEIQAQRLVFERKNLTVREAISALEASRNGIPDRH